MNTDSLIQQVDTMSGERFERFICWLFQEKNYKVQRVGTQLYRNNQRRIKDRYFQKFRDYGADVLIEKSGERTAVQTKRCQRPVGKEAVKQAAKARRHYGCHKALVISNNSYTQSALKYARRKGIGLWNRDILIQAVTEDYR